ncbi:hypothetical protein [Allohahella sp. A8]|uniref:hypothetical protein n=1 Tax=Allohahella sp. A8 TaxID=3141461 RepID=UPI000C09BBCD|nr:hypothetical protein [Hahellaceae bacterium]|tara:strand:+ start:17647 stop:18171 length:525 start_codon:yes stop_codon:yes gene_type:complete
MAHSIDTSDIWLLDIEAYSGESDSFPVAIAWGIMGGHINHELIIPEDEWLEEAEDQPTTSEFNLNDLRERGTTALDIIRQLNEELADKRVVVDGLDIDEALLERLYEPYSAEPSFEIHSLTNFLSDNNIDYDFHELYERRTEFVQEQAQGTDEAEKSVFALHQLIEEYVRRNDD